MREFVAFREVAGLHLEVLTVEGEVGFGRGEVEGCRADDGGLAVWAQSGHNQVGFGVFGVDDGEDRGVGSVYECGVGVLR